MKTITIDGIEYTLTPVHTESANWRLPTITELLLLVDYTKYGPACTLDDTYSSGYWSSSLDVSGSSDAWYVYFEYGYSYYDGKSSKRYVRCVREIEDKLEWSKSSDTQMTWDEAFVHAKTLTEKDKYENETN